MAGFERQKSKGTLPDQQIEALGLTINTVTRELRVSPDKLIEIYNLLCECPEVKVCTKRNLLSLIGKLSFTSQAVRAGRTFLRRLIGLSKKVKYLHYKITMNQLARDDIEWWKICLNSDNSMVRFPTQ